MSPVMETAHTGPGAEATDLSARPGLGPQCGHRFSGPCSYHPYRALRSWARYSTAMHTHVCTHHTGTLRAHTLPHVHTPRTRAHTHTHACPRMHTHTGTHVCTHPHMQTHECAHTHACVHITTIWTWLCGGRTARSMAHPPRSQTCTASCKWRTASCKWAHGLL